jgi:hypothetical protein
MSNDIDDTQSQIEQPMTDGPDLARRSALFRLVISGASVAAVGFLAPRHAHAAFGRCTNNGCNCCAYQGNTNNCSNCGHQYTDHGGGTCEKP